MDDRPTRVVGAPRSGTNYVRWLLRENYEVTLPTGLHAHDMPAGDCDTVLVVKHPMPWAVSAFEWYLQHPGNGRPPMLNPTVVGGSFRAWLLNSGALFYWNAINRAWLAAQAQVVRYDDVLADAELTLDGLGFVRETEEFVRPVGHVSNSGDDTELRFDGRRAYYEREGWQKYYDVRTRAYMDQWIDAGLMTALGLTEYRRQ